MTTAAALYRGRFAPSPTGPLHFGSLVAAMGSYLEARSRGGEWLLRIEDVDAPRCSQAAAGQILSALEACGFEWDGEPVWQSRRGAAYAAALERLKTTGLVFPCACTRRELADSALAPDGAAIYPGTCRAGLTPGREARAWRLRVGQARIGFDDAVQGRIESDLATEAGDFVLRRADGLFAYQLAVVVDDGRRHHPCGARRRSAAVDRAPDLPAALPGGPTPAYLHLPVAVNAAGEKLSKQTLALALDLARPVPALHAALDFLGQQPPADLARGTVAELWAWAVPNWRPERCRAGRRPRPPRWHNRLAKEVHHARR
jgi:glutamyl-Q tRNA(Asp) synthetase